MNKKQAAEFLGVSVRALERYVQQGKLTVRYEKGKTRPTANFDQRELEAFKEELNQPTIKPAVESRQITTEVYDEPDIVPVTMAEFGEFRVIDRLAGMVEMLITRGDKKPTVPIESKILLTLDEAQAMTGLSKGYLREAIGQGNLKAKQIGKSWRVKRCDLDNFVENLF
ncbi:MAG: helix-turn-helix domain-containing protein [Cyanobacteria bacterium P01_A01_bin.84]